MGQMASLQSFVSRRRAALTVTAGMRGLMQRPS
jgi:hypothetical protein